MADAAKRFYGPAQPGVAAATLYTAPAGGAILRYIHVCNPTGSDRTITLSVGANAAAAQIFSTITVLGGGGTFEWHGFIPLAAGDIIQGLASAASALTTILAGVET